MAYYKDVKILIYVRRGAYTLKQTERNVEKFNMLKVLMATAFRDVELNARTLCRGYKFLWHEDAGALEIDMPNARWESHYNEVKELQEAILDLGSNEHQYCVEHAIVNRNEPRDCQQLCSPNIQNPLLSLEVRMKVNL
jgi:hypothetical protein